MTDRYSLTPLEVYARPHAEFIQRWRRIIDVYGNTIAAIGEGSYFFAPLPKPAPKTHSADRTRSPRWRAGSRRTKKLGRLARRQGRRSPFADPFKGWTDLGWTYEGNPVEAEEAA